MKRLGALVPFLLACLVLAACTAREEPPERSGPTVVRIDDAVPALAVGEDYDVVTRVATELDGRVATIAGWTRDGTEVYVRHAESATGDAEDADPHAVALVARDAEGRTTVLSDRARRQGPVARDRIPGDALQILSVAVASDLVVWLECRGGCTHGDLFVHDVATGSERRLVRSVASTSATAPVVHEGHVYFVGVDGDDLAAVPQRTSVYRVPVDGAGEIELVAPEGTGVYANHGIFGSPSDGLVSVVLADRIVRWDPEAGADGEVEDSVLPADCGAAADEGVTVACDGSPATVTVRTLEGTFVIEDVPGAVSDLQAHRNWVAFATEAAGRRTQYVFHVERRALLRVPAGRSLRLVPSGMHDWATLSTRDRAPTETVIDIRR